MIQVLGHIAYVLGFYACVATFRKTRSGARSALIPFAASGAFSWQQNGLYILPGSLPSGFETDRRNRMTIRGKHATRQNSSIPGDPE
jgi:hypothetical protein